jgi:hypothetical protein
VYFGADAREVGVGSWGGVHLQAYRGLGYWGAEGRAAEGAFGPICPHLLCLVRQTDGVSGDPGRKPRSSSDGQLGTGLACPG